ncbi:MAG: hypothetical protein AAGC55_23450 [Myxococcota bacterium]
MSPPHDPDNPLIAAVDATVPAPVRQVCARLSEAGHEAYAVGGAVRDAALGRSPGDWDVATSATPDQVTELFAKTIPTGLQHGTVTVLERGADRQRQAIEVTTFRGEGAYSDGRRPDSVHFGVPLREDLARRDFVINAMAYDPIARRLVDPFGGMDDLKAGRVRAVGAAERRFAEDGLRVMRAVRFAAVLEFALDPATEAAIAGALPVLARVSRERVRDELVKLLGAGRPSRGLLIARRTGLLDAILPELDLPGPAAPAAAGDPHGNPSGDPSGDPDGDPDGDNDPRWQRALARVDALERDPILRLAALLMAAPAALPSSKSPDSPGRRLKLSNAELARIDGLLAMAPRWRDPGTDSELRRALGQLGRRYIPDVLALWQAERAALEAVNAPAEDRPGAPDTAAEQAALSAVLDRVQAMVARGDALTAGELALSGGELIRLLELAPGPAIGRLLAALLDRVLAEPALNTRESLSDLARSIHSAQE